MKDTREALALVRTMQGWYVSRYAIQWGITLRDEDRVLGLCGLHDWNRQHRRAALGYDLVRSHWGRGLAFEAMQAVLRFGFEEMDLNRVEALTIVENQRSILLEASGVPARRDQARELPRTGWPASRERRLQPAQVRVRGRCRPRTSGASLSERRRSFRRTDLTP